MLLIAGLLTGALAFRLGRRLLVDKPGRVDRVMLVGLPPLIVQLLHAFELWQQHADRVNSRVRQGETVSSPDS